MSGQTTEHTRTPRKARKYKKIKSNTLTHQYLKQQHIIVQMQWQEGAGRGQYRLTHIPTRLQYQSTTSANIAGRQLISSDDTMMSEGYQQVYWPIYAAVGMILQ